MKRIVLWAYRRYTDDDVRWLEHTISLLRECDPWGREIDLILAPVENDYEPLHGVEQLRW